jgi:hypothetical protein
MAKSPKRPEEIFAELTGDYRQVFGADLISLILYGSGAGKDYVPGKSDLNFLVTLTDPGIENLERALEMVTRWRKRSVAVPLFMTRPFVRASLDAYPIEFLSMRRQYVVVFGEDVLAELDFTPSHIRLQLERELRSKLLHLRSGYLVTEGNTRKIRELITASLTAFVSLLGAMLHLRNAEIPPGKREVIAAAGKTLGIDSDLFLKCEAIRNKTDRFSAVEVKTVFSAYLKEIARLCDQIDQMVV